MSLLRRTSTAPVAGPASRVAPKQPSKPRAPRKTYKPGMTPEQYNELEAQAAQAIAALDAARKQFSKGSPPAKPQAIPPARPPPQNCSRRQRKKPRR